MSANFIASDFIANDELPPLLEAAKSEGAVVLPLIISPCRFLQTPRSQYQAVNSPSQTLLSMSEAEQEEMFLKLTYDVEHAYTI